MKKNTYCFKITLLCTAIALFSACETGVKHTTEQESAAPSGIIDKGSSGYVGSQKSSENIKIKKIFSNSATPGYYLQVGYFGNHKPNSSFMKHLNNSGFNYIILDKNGNHYALVGAYGSYNQAKNKLSSVKSSLSYKAFVVQVLRP